jgi:crotonobetainyl-CoA:carnitine CoA-transferase CaiB-like acyl-CoA transferase
LVAASQPSRLIDALRKEKPMPKGARIVEIEALGPTPFVAMLLAGLGVSRLR